MATARQRMLELSPLASGHAARAHFLAIQQQAGGLIITEGDYVVNEIQLDSIVEQMSEVEVELVLQMVSDDSMFDSVSELQRIERIGDGNI